MTIYLGLGTNIENRKQNIERAIDALLASGFELQHVSPLIESPALLQSGADSSWDKPYLNAVVSGDADWEPQQGLAIAKKIEKSLGRVDSKRWAPRPIDIDLLYWHGRSLEHSTFTIPHPDITQRDFVLTPLLHLQADLPIGEQSESVFSLTQTIRPIPLWMAVINITPDSFSDGDLWMNSDSLSAHIDKLIDHNVQIIDIGAESSRPGGSPLSTEEEWARLEPVLAQIAERLQGKSIKPWISVDSRHPTIIQQALRYNIDIINDVQGLTDVEMLAIVKDSDCQAIATHSLSIPVDATVTLSEESPAIRQIEQWTESKMESWVRAGLDLNRIILDPGIGFGKTRLQSFNLLAHCRELRQFGLRLLVGHSRKSFMRGMTDQPAHLRDIETLGISLALCEQEVDIIRVHEPFMHMRAYLAWAHIMANNRNH